jgi:AraC family transcriptional regulator
MVSAALMNSLADLDAYAPGQVWIDGTECGWEDISLRGYRYQSLAPGKPTRFAHHALVLYLAGSARVTRESAAGREQVVVAPGDISVQDTSWFGSWAWQGALDVLHLYLEPGLIERTATAVHGREVCGQLRDDLKVRDDTIMQIGSALAREAQASEPGSRIVVRALREQLAVHLVRHYFVHTREPSLGGRRITKLRALFDDLGGDLSLPRLAKAAGVGPHQLVRLFRKTFGTTPHQYVMELRLARARELLADSEQTVSDISAATGFADQSHLTRYFTRRYGASPSRFRAGLRDT